MEEELEAIQAIYCEPGEFEVLENGWFVGDNDNVLLHLCRVFMQLGLFILINKIFKKK